MSAQGLEVIDETVQQTHTWIKDLAERIGTPDRREAMRLMRAVLSGIRDHLAHDEAAHLSAQLPVLVRGFYWEGWRPSQTPVHPRGKTALLERVGAACARAPDAELEADVVSALRLLNAHVTEGEIRDVRNSLPQDLREVWPA